MVPNAPCGVESLCRFCKYQSNCSVPNAPCGVESSEDSIFTILSLWFLMHRVELKVLNLVFSGYFFIKFLMHRVELKVDWVFAEFRGLNSS